MEVVYGTAVEVLKRVATVANDEINLAWGMQDDIKKLQDTTSTLKAVLLDAEKKQEGNEQLNLWLRRLKDLFLDARDVLDEYECELLRREVVKTHGSFGRKVCRYFSGSNPLAFCFSIAHQIKAIRQKLDDVAKEMSNFQLIEHHQDERQVRREMTSSFVRPSEVVGRESDKEKIVNALMQENNNDVISVIPIVGVGGLGKTALAKLAYNDDRVTGWFDLKLWVCVQQDFNVTELTREILKSSIVATNRKNENFVVHQLLMQTRDMSNLSIDQLQMFLQTILKDKKVLLVLDDIWNEDRVKWNEMRDLLLTVCAMGSRIIVTTRHSPVASIMGTIPAHYLKCLSEEDSLSLFFKDAFGDEKSAENFPKLKHIGKQIVQKCGGLPLALKTLGSLLYSKTVEGEWIRIRDSKIWEVKGEHNETILSALRLSYDTMSPCLKQCFAYCSLVPKNVQTSDLKMILMWMALGIIQSPDDSEVELDIGKMYFKDLCGRSFFQNLQDAEKFLNVFQRFEMHDLIHGLATSIIQFEHSTINSQTKNIPDQRVRHLRIFLKDGHGQSILAILQKLKKVHSIFLDYEKDEKPKTEESFLMLSTCISQFRYLRLFDLWRLSFDELPSSIGTLKHLRYLNLAENKKIKKLPDSICKLQNLQTLLLDRCSELEELPRDIRNLVSLRVFLVTTKQTSFPENGIGRMRSLQFLALGECRNLRSLPQDMRYCSTLRTLVLLECNQLELASGLGEVIQLSLQTFIIVNLPQTTALPQWLHGAAQTLQHMSIYYCPKLAALPDWLPDLTSLERLHILGCPQLTSLPEGMQRLTSLTRLEISKCHALEERCKPQSGEDWPKIAHVRNRVIGNQPPPDDD